MYIIRKRLLTTEGNPPGTRYNPDCDCVETTVDGGTTWTENPGADPRINPAYQAPPNTAPDPRCAAAAGMVHYIRTIVDAGIDGSTISGIGTTILAGVLLFLPISWFFALIAIIAESLIAIGGAALAFSFTEGVYDELLCIFYAQLDGDGRLDEAGLDAALAAANTQIGDFTVDAVLELTKQLAGFVGFNNAGVRYADPDADCATCAAWAELCNFEIEDYGFEAQLFGAVPLATYTSGVGWTADYVPTGGNGYTIAAIARMIAADLTHLEMGIEYTQGSCFPSGDTAAGLRSQGSANIFYDSLVCDVPTSPLVWDYTIDPGVPVTITQLTAQLVAGVTPDDSDPGGSATIKYIRMCGVGTPPGVGVPDDPC